jgi:hypothetical protein
LNKTIKFKHEGEISQERLERIWVKNFPKVPFPNVEAYLTTEEIVLKTEKRIRNLSSEVKEASNRANIKEYGAIIEGHTKAFVAYNGHGIFTILTCVDSDESLEHELRHIYKGDWKE